MIRQAECAPGALARLEPVDTPWGMARTNRQPVATTHKIRAWRTERGLTLEQLASAIGMTNQNLGKIERGLVPLGEEYHLPLARALGVRVPDLFRLPDETDPDEPLIAVIGSVGANPDGTVLFATGDAPHEFAPIPPGGTEKARGLRVVGHSMRGFADDGALIYFEDQRTPPTPDMLRHVVVVETEDGQVLVKRLLKGSRPGVYDLESLIGPLLEDVRLRWAAHVSAIIPPFVAQRVIRREAA